MNQRRHLAVVAGAATVLASTALASVYESKGYFLFVLQSPNWFLYVAAVVAAVVGGAIGARALRAPVWAQPVAAALALLLYVTVVFGDGFLGFVPTPGSFDTLGNQIATAFREIAELSAPVPIRRGLLLLAVLGVGFVAIIVDFLAVTLRRASLAGLPLLALYAVPVSIDREGMRWWTFALGAIGYLWLLATDHIERVQRWGRPFRSGSQDEVWATTPLGSTGRWVGAFGIAIALFIPVLVPGLSATGWFAGGPGSGLGNGSGRSVQTINPMTQLRGQLTDDEEREVFRLRTNDRDRFYVRTTTLDQFSAVGWTQRRLTALNQDRVGNGIPPEDDINAEIPSRKQSTRIEIKAFNRSSYLPIYANPTKIDVRGDWRWDDRADTVFSSRSSTDGLRYTFESVRIIYDRERLAAAPDLDPSESVVSEYTGINRGSEPEAQKIAENAIAGKQTQYEKVMAINDYFSTENDFRYTTETQAGTTGSDLMDFLSNKQGYCEQYASAMAYLVRAVGIPARVAVGFGRGTETRDYISVTNKDAHAWVEVYFSGFGWVPFDPTPPGGAGRTGGLPWAQTENNSGTGNTPGNNPANPEANPTPTGPNPNDLAEDPEADLAQNRTSGGPKQLSVPTWLIVAGGPVAAMVDGRQVPDVPVWLRWLLGIAATMLVCALPGFVRIRVRRHRMRLARSADPQVAAHAAWDELVDSLADLGLAAGDSETPRSTAARLARTGLDDAERHAIDLLARAEERARYAPPGLLAAGVPGAAGASRPSRADRGRADAARRAEVTQRIHAVHVVWHALADRATLNVKLRALLLPPSLLTRAALTLSRWSEETSIAVRDVQGALRRRLLPSRFTNA